MRVPALLVAFLLLSGCGSSTPPAGSSAAQDAGVGGSAQAAAGLAHFQGDGWSFDHPATWLLSKVEEASSFSDTVGYLGTIGVDPGAICQHTANSVSCNARGYALPPGNVVIQIAHWGTPMIDPVAVYDHPSGPSRVVVGDMPALASLEGIGADRTVLTWQVARPDAFGNWIQFDADIRGPGQAAMRAQVEAMIASFRFEPPPMPLAAGEAAANAIAAKAVAELVALDPGSYACFPDRPGVTKHALVGILPGFPSFGRQVPVSCTIAIAPTDVGFWKMALVATWTAAGDRSAGSATSVQWLFPDGTLSASSSAGADPP